jgi:hypothetical protein
MAEPNYGNLYNYQTGAYIRPATRSELIKTLRRVTDSDCGAWEDPFTGAYVYVSDEDLNITHELTEWLAANEPTDPNNESPTP